MTHHQKLDCDQRQKEHESDYVVATNDELSEGLNHTASCRYAFTAMQQDAAAGCDVQREAKQCEEQQNRWEY